MTVRENLAKVYEELYRKKNALFIGYNVWKGGRMYGTLNQVPREGCNETPCAENLMVGTAIGLALEGSRLPVLCFERHEFALFSMGLLAVMADKFTLVTNRVRIPMVVRIVKGAEGPLKAGEQHCWDYRKAIEEACSLSIVLDMEDLSYERIIGAMEYSSSGIVIIMEERDGYEETV